VTFYTSFVYPAVLVACAMLVIVGTLVVITARIHRVLQWVVSGTYVIAALQGIMVIVGLVTSQMSSLPVALGYLIATLALLPLLGIARLGTPDAAAASGDPNHPVLAPDQIARVDGGAAIIVGIAMAVASWRITELIVVAS